MGGEKQTGEGKERCKKGQRPWVKKETQGAKQAKHLGIRPHPLKEGPRGDLLPDFMKRKIPKTERQCKTSRTEEGQ